MRFFGWELRRAPIEPRVIIERVRLDLPVAGGKWITLFDLSPAWFVAAIERKGVWELATDGALKSKDGKQFRFVQHRANVYLYGSVEK